MNPPAARGGGVGKPMPLPLPTGDPATVWPALPRPGVALTAALLQQLDRSQWWPPGELRRQQFRQAAALLDHAWRHVPFYRERLAGAGFHPGTALTPRVWSRIPALRRGELQQAGEALASPVVPPRHGEVHETSSSGSTGQVVTVRGTQLTQLVWEALTLRDHLSQRRDPRGRLAAIRPYPAGAADYPQGALAKDWGSSASGLFPGGPCNMLNINTTAPQQAEWLLRVRPAYLLTYPSTLRELLLHCREQAITIPGLREVRTLSETLPPETRDLCREVWGLPIVDGYSCQETGLLALQCPEQEHYHVQGEAVLLEVLNEAGEACGPGEAGEVVITSLMNFAMPLIRYALGDMAEVGPPCPCGRGLPVLSRVLGRQRNTLRYPDGRRGWPMMGDIFHAGVAGIRQYQILQHGLDDIEMKLATAAPLGAEDEAKLREWLHFRSGYPFKVRFSYAAGIPRGPSGKFETFISRIPAENIAKQKD
ncbi:hypothetical protein AAFN88_02360 [Pelagibius sp. CAU 1746]|uniref:phenylacetate--CoA ligase family protein n=1 Tax=Pelagibius sp. CAU 1746 TaxID=3140370 RepID=UPI00325BCB29